MVKFSIAAVALMATAVSGTVQANEFQEQIERFYTSSIQGWLSDPQVIEAIKAQNAETAAYTDAKIEELDQQWRAEADSGTGPLIDDVLGRGLSEFLKAKKSEHAEAITEMFVMDAKGLNVGQSDVTSDYMQGDEAKWQKTFGTGAAAVFVDEVEFDDSSSSFQSQISATIVDPATQSPIGAITVGLNVESLL